MERRFPESDEWLQNVVNTNRKDAVRNNLSPWHSEVIVYGHGWLAMAEMRDEPESFQHSQFGNTTTINVWARDVLQRLTQINAQFFESPVHIREPLMEAKTAVFLQAGEEFRRRRDYDVFPQISAVLGANRDRFSRLTFDTLSADLYTLYLLACQEDRFLIGARDGGQWKRVTLPPLTTASERMMRVYDLTMNYLTNLGSIGRREAVLVPDNPINLAENAEVRLPNPARSTEDLLEDAFFRQRYIVPTDGAEVRFRRAGDLQRMIVMHSRNRILANVLTEHGEALVTLDTNTANWSSPDIYLPTPPQESRWATILSEVYHDIVTAEEIPTTRYRRLRGPQQTPLPIPGPEDFLDEPEVIYIPRRVRVGEEEAPRLPYVGPPRPIRPHRVSGHRRRANMTNEQRLNILELERQLGINILRFIPDGHTFVRPHVSPRGAQVGFRNLPIFIKRRIETRLQEDLQVNS